MQPTNLYGDAHRGPTKHTHPIRKKKPRGRPPERRREEVDEEGDHEHDGRQDDPPRYPVSPQPLRPKGH